MTHRRVLPTLLATFITTTLAQAQSPPQKALESLKAADGLEVRLFASEPLVNNPTAIDIDPMGRVWVAEGVNYRHLLRGNTQGQVHDERADRIKILEDVDGDGRADRVTVFADGLIVPMSVAVAGFEQPGKGGKVYVGESPNLWVFEDTDGDLVADTKEAVLTGFGGKDHDHGIHGLVLGPDGRLYFTVGDEGMDVTDRSGKHVKPLAGAVCRVNLDGTDLTVLADNFRNPYEPCIDSFGEVFLSDNDIDGRRGVRICWVLEGGSYGWKGPPSPGGNHWREDLPGYVHKILGTGNGSPCGILCYEGTLFGNKYVGALIHADAGPHVIRAYHLEPEGAGYSCTPEVLVSSNDEWFRPVDVCTHPDGSIYIADWYDAGVGGHRYSDNNTGRIYRLLPKGKRAEMPNLDLESPAGMVAALRSTNIATRYVASRQLLGSLQSEGDSDVKAEVQKVLRPSPFIVPRVNDSPLPQIDPARLRLLSLLVRKNLNKNWTISLLHNGDWRIRALAIRLRREHGGQFSADMALSENNPQVLRELVLAARESQDAELLAALASRWDGEDHFYLAALGIALRDRDPELVASIFEPNRTKSREAAMVKLAWELQRAEAVPFLREVLEGDGADELKLGAMEALWHIKDPGAGALLADVARSDEDAQRRRVALGYLGSRLAGPWSELQESKALEQALDRALSEPELAAVAVATIAEGQVGSFGPRLADLVGDADTSGRLKVASIEALGRLRSTGALPLLEEQVQRARIDPEQAGTDAQAEADPVALAALRTAFEIDRKWAHDMARDVLLDSAYLAGARQEAVRLLGSSREGAGELLDLAQNGRLPAAVKGTATQAVHSINDANVRARAEKLLPRPKAATGKPLPPIGELVEQNGDAQRGKEIFFREGTAGQASSGTPAEPSGSATGALCSRCHRVRGEGAWVGPDLSQIGTKLAREALYDAILNPSAGIAHEYRAFNVITSRGQVHTGLVLEDSEQRLVLKTAEGERVTVPRDEVDEAEPQPVSLMPENLAATLSETDLVDLVAYLETLKEPATAIAGWHVLSPLASEARPDFAADVDLDARHAGQDGTPIAWRPLRADRDGRLDPELREKAAAYLYATVRSPESQPAELVVEGSGGLEVSANGRAVRTEGDANGRYRRYRVELAQGENHLLLRLSNGTPDSEWFVTLVSAQPIEQ